MQSIDWDKSSTFLDMNELHCIWSEQQFFAAGVWKVELTEFSTVTYILPDDILFPI